MFSAIAVQWRFIKVRRRYLLRQDIIDFILLAALWGLSFLFMRIAVPEFGPLSLIFLRCFIGAVTLLIILLVLGKAGDLMSDLWLAGFTGILNSAIPFVLLAISALSISTGMLSILNATAPIWGAIVGYVWLQERLTRSQLIGLGVGFLGVLILVRENPGDTGATRSTVTLALLAALGATLAYGVAANFAKKYLHSTNPLATAAGSQVGATLVLVIPGLLWWPDNQPGLQAWVALILLGVFSTGIAYLLFFRLVRNIGPIRTITVTFAIPVFGMLFGYLILDEPITTSMLVGAAVVVVGCTLTIKLLSIPGLGTRQQ